MEAHNALGIPTRFLDAVALKRHLAVEHGCGAIFDPGTGQINGAQLVRSLAPGLAAQGVAMHAGTPVLRAVEGLPPELRDAITFREGPAGDADDLRDHPAGNTCQDKLPRKQVGGDISVDPGDNDDGSALPLDFSFSPVNDCGPFPTLPPGLAAGPPRSHHQSLHLRA